MLDMLPRNCTGRKRTFKFQTYWLIDPTFPRIVSHAWRQPNILVEAIENFTKEALIWNKVHFGNIFAKKKRIMARLDGVQRALANDPSSSLIQMESQLLMELDIVNGQETELWALKARMNWLVLGDRNTSFYHISALARRKRNHILSVKNGAGDWLFKERDVMNYFREGFLKLYTSSQDSATWDLNYHLQWQAKLLEEEKDSISHMVSEEEISAALWSLKAFKAPRLDSLHARFF